MTKRQGPGVYSDIGKNIRGLLYRDFTFAPKICITASNPNHHDSTTFFGTKKNDCFYVAVGNFSKKHSNVSYAKLTPNSRSFSSTSLNEIKFAPGFKGIVGVHPFQKSYMMGIQYTHDYIGCTTSLKLRANPVIDFSGVIGTNVLSLGTDVSFSTGTRNFTKYNFGWSLYIKNTILSMTLNDKGDTLKASYYQLLRPSTNTAVGVEIARTFSTEVGDAIIGVEHTLNQFTKLKTRLSVNGIVSGLIQHELWPKTRVLVCGEIDTKDIRRWPKIGAALEFEFLVN